MYQIYKNCTMFPFHADDGTTSNTATTSNEQFEYLHCYFIHSVNRKRESFRIVQLHFEIETARYMW